jgi:glycosyltransferase involved in cell wall biosynthesis
MQFPPNAAAACWLVRRVWPHVWRAIGGGQHHRPKTPDPVRLAIVGTSPTLRVRRLAGTPGVVVTGAVDDVGAWLKRARLAVAPMVTGSGIKNKVLEASAAACPVVATSLGVAGLPSGDNNGSLAADRAAEFADKIVTLLQNPALARTIGLAGRAMVSRQYSWPRMAQRMLRILEGPQPAGSTPTCEADSPNPLTHALSVHQSESSREKESLAHASS